MTTWLQRTESIICGTGMTSYTIVWLCSQRKPFESSLETNLHTALSKIHPVPTVMYYSVTWSRLNDLDPLTGKDRTPGFSSGAPLSPLGDSQSGHQCLLTWNEHEMKTKFVHCKPVQDCPATSSNSLSPPPAWTNNQSLPTCLPRLHRLRRLPRLGVFCVGRLRALQDDGGHGGWLGQHYWYRWRFIWVR